MFTRGALFRAEVFKALAVEFADPGFGSDPDIAPAVLNQGYHLLLCQAIVYGKVAVGQLEGLLAREGTQTGKQEYGDQYGAFRAEHPSNIRRAYGRLYAGDKYGRIWRNTGMPVGMWAGRAAGAG